MIDGQEQPSKTRIEAIQHMSNEAFARKYSTETTPPSHFSDKIGYFITNENDYPWSLKDIKVRGGIHLAVMGGVDPVLGQIAAASPDLTIMIDINQSSLQVTTEGRIKPIAESQNSTEYWRKVGDYFNNTVKKINPNRWDFPIDQDSMNGGWSSPEHFPKVKDAVARGRVKWAAGDLTKDGIELALKLANETESQVRLVYVSNIFDYSKHNKEEFAKRLAKGIEEGTLDPHAQIIHTASIEGLKTEIYDVADYIHANTSE